MYTDIDYEYNSQLSTTFNLTVKNNRAQRALDRSPEEKVKGHSGAIYRGPIVLSTKYW